MGIGNRLICIVGAGPAGLQAAWILAKRGHDVTVYEKEKHIGGQFAVAAYPPGKADLVKPYTFNRRVKRLTSCCKNDDIWLYFQNTFCMHLGVKLIGHAKNTSHLIVIGCHQGCTKNLLTGKALTCLVNPFVGREAELQIKPADQVKKICIVGAGPAGFFLISSAYFAI